MSSETLHEAADGAAGGPGDGSLGIGSLKGRS